jgi:hypothetical protein
LSGHAEVPAALGDAHVPALQGLAVGGLGHVHGGDAVEPPGEGRGEPRGHVLHHHDGRRIGAHAAQHLGQGLGAAGGRGDGDQDVVVTAGSGRRRGRGSGREEGPRRRGGHRRAGRDARSHAAQHRRLHDLQQALAVGLEKAPDALGGLRHHIDGAGRERAQGEVAARRRRARAHHHGHRTHRHETLQELDAVHAGHHQVEHDGRGGRGDGALEGDRGVAVGRHAQRGVGAEHQLEGLPHDRGVVDDEDVHRVAHGASLGSVRV